MKLFLECTIDDMNEILTFVENKITIKDKNINAIVHSSIDAVKDVISDDIKIKLINNILNRSNEKICDYVTVLISEKLFTIKIDDIRLDNKICG